MVVQATRFYVNIVNKYSKALFSWCANTLTIKGENENED